MAMRITEHKPNSPPDLAQHYREEIEALLKDPATRVETRHMPAAVNGEEHEWVESGFGTDAIRSMLNWENWRDGYEFRVQPKGRHVWAPMGESAYGSGLLKMGYSHNNATAAFDERSGLTEVLGYIHLELSLEDNKVRIVEYLSPEEMKEMIP